MVLRRLKVPGARVFRDSVTGRIFIEGQDENGKPVGRLGFTDEGALRMIRQVASLLKPALVDPRFDPRLPMRRFE